MSRELWQQLLFAIYSILCEGPQHRHRTCKAQRYTFCTYVIMCVLINRQNMLSRSGWLIVQSSTFWLESTAVGVVQLKLQMKLNLGTRKELPMTHQWSGNRKCGQCKEGEKTSCLGWCFQCDAAPDRWLAQGPSLLEHSEPASTRSLRDAGSNKMPPAQRSEGPRSPFMVLFHHLRPGGATPLGCEHQLHRVPCLSSQVWLGALLSCFPQPIITHSSPNHKILPFLLQLSKNNLFHMLNPSVGNT